MQEYLKETLKLLDSQIPFVFVILVEDSGSTPQDTGSRMLVTSMGRHWGTIGGGRVEVKAIEEAQNLLCESSPLPQTRLHHWNLNKDVGMTCGGSVSIFFERSPVLGWTIALYGAGHIGQVLVRLLLNLECNIICLESRKEWLDRLPDHQTLRKRLEPDLPATVESISKQTFVLLMTPGHTTDRPILKRFLERGGQSFLGVIGSRAKAATLRKEMSSEGFSPSQLSSFCCPLGLSLGSNHPYEIAISITAQLLHERDRLFGILHQRNPLPTCQDTTLEGT